MRFPLASQLHQVLRRRKFYRDNPDLSKAVGSSAPQVKDVSRVPTPLSQAQLEHWNDFGFLVLKGFFEPSVLDEYKHHVDTLWRTRKRRDNPVVIYSARGGHYFRDAIEEDRLQTYRLLDHYLLDPLTRDLSMDPRLIDIIHQIFGHTPVVCNSLLFEWGSEQDMHSDMFYMPPNTENQMLATWLAIDDVTEDNGPLIYVPGSHKLRPHRFSNGRVDAVTEEVAGAVVEIQERMAEQGLRTERFYAKRGDLLIWHSQLMHGGDVIRDQTARRTSLVTHYYSTCDIPIGICAKRADGSMLLIKDHVQLAGSG